MWNWVFPACIRMKGIRIGTGAGGMAKSCQFVNCLVPSTPQQSARYISCAFVQLFKSWLKPWIDVPCGYRYGSGRWTHHQHSRTFRCRAWRHSLPHTIHAIPWKVTQVLICCELVFSFCLYFSGNFGSRTSCRVYYYGKLTNGLLVESTALTVVARQLGVPTVMEAARISVMATEEQWQWRIVNDALVWAITCCWWALMTTWSWLNYW